MFESLATTGKTGVGHEIAVSAEWLVDNVRIDAGIAAI